MNRSKRSIVFLWENFGPVHVDRCEAVSERLRGEYRVVGIEIYRRSKIYDWTPAEGKGFEKITVFEANENPGFFKRLLYISRLLIFIESPVLFVCHYERMEIFLIALFNRLFARKVYLMCDSKMDDKPRRNWREFLKNIFMLPYCGVITHEGRSETYMEFHGFRKERIKTPYNAINLERIRSLSEAPQAPDGTPFESRHFTIVARLVSEKNISVAIEAYEFYRRNSRLPRDLIICGSGPLENKLKEEVARKGLDKSIKFLGFCESPEVARVLSRTLALILPSSREPFGIVVSEAQAMGLPVIVSSQVGARDKLVHSAVNGFVFEPDNPEGLAWFMAEIADDKALWERMCKSATHFATQSRVDLFADAVESMLVDGRKKSLV